jgi:hypothetical protein
LLRQLEYDLRLTRLGLWTFEERQNRVDLIEVFKMSDITVHTRGHAYKLKKDFCRSEPCYHFVSNQAINR